MTRFLRTLRFIAIALAFAAVLSFVVMRLWNWLMPGLFGLHELGYWQALGLLVLSKILFGGFRRPGPPHRHWRHRMWERWEKMTPEEREKFRQGAWGRCGIGSPAMGSKA